MVWISQLPLLDNELGRHENVQNRYGQEPVAVAASHLAFSSDLLVLEIGVSEEPMCQGIKHDAKGRAGLELLVEIDSAIYISQVPIVKVPIFLPRIPAVV